MVQIGLIVTACMSSREVFWERTISSTLMPPGATHSLQLVLFHVHRASLICALTRGWFWSLLHPAPEVAGCNLELCIKRESSLHTQTGVEQDQS